MRPSRESAVGLYVFGKHPAWRDFIDPSKLPPTPPLFQDFHRRLRSAVESCYVGEKLSARLLLWRDRQHSAALLILPSRDTADPATGRSRSSPLFIGLCARASFRELHAFAAPRLVALSASLQKAGRTAEDFLDAVRRAESAWPGEFEAGRDVPATIRISLQETAAATPRSTDIRDLFAVAMHCGWDVAQEARSSLVLVAAAEPRGAFVEEIALSSLQARQLKDALKGPPPLTRAAPESRDRETGAVPGQSPSAPASNPFLLPVASSIPVLLEAVSDRPLVMSAATGNRLAIAHTDTGDPLVRVTLASRRGSLRLARTEGIAFATGGGESILLEFTGSHHAVNAALDGMRFTPARGFVGAASIQIMAHSLARAGRARPILSASVPIEVRHPGPAAARTPSGTHVQERVRSLNVDPLGKL